jgi:hypothetical protein
MPLFELVTNELIRGSCVQRNGLAHHDNSTVEVISPLLLFLQSPFLITTGISN